MRSVDSLQFDFDSIKAATNNFSEENKLARGGFGAVYKGRLFNHEDVAVKRLSKDSAQGDLEFKNEVLLVAKLQHRLVRLLIGFCLKGAERLLVYEFVPNASLNQFIFEHVMRGQFSVKSDAYSSGAWRSWREGSAASNLIDNSLMTGSRTEIMKCIHIGLLCVQQNIGDRPTIASVIHMLTSNSLTLPVPSQPSFLMIGSGMPGILGSSRSKSNSVLNSVSEASITELSPR
ncbi:putative protein kinase RLK-Pelle-DLSV family [Rosa chinensis]|uniref:Protein kinase domain-containing protein n=1 Tax=Rosa chinensis TaxID=74649 RepID=A0A2P6PU69_ROSCH|nr:putative protein kinase RLK-Pelle-DLSV family [Rosa chinensis]